MGMLDRICANEVEPDVVQISGGEPTLHPRFFDILDECKRRPIRHLMVNTNGIKIASDPAFAQRLAGYMPAFELYLQFDSLRAEPQQVLRGKDLREVRSQAMARLEALGISTTLVVTVRKGLNDGELGDIIEHALGYACVRGVTFQPVQDEGRNDGFDPKEHRLTLTELRRRTGQQTTRFILDDLIPVPCHPDSLAMAYGLRDGKGGVVPLTRQIPADVLMSAGRNTITLEKEEALQQALFKAFSTAHGPLGAATSLKELLCCLPTFQSQSIGYQDVFRVIIMQFLDRHSIDMRFVRKSCVHIAHPDGKRVMPFDTYNLFYRDDLEKERLAPLRARVT
jgi:7,8-dihydro-6-hydroxymethylpterin dimethyltransferase